MILLFPGRLFMRSAVAAGGKRGKWKSGRRRRHFIVQDFKSKSEESCNAQREVSQY